MSEKNPLFEPIIVTDGDGQKLDLRLTVGAVKRWLRETGATLKGGSLRSAKLDDVLLFVCLCAKKKQPDMTVEQVEEMIEIGPLLATLYEAWDQIAAFWPKIEEEIGKLQGFQRKVEGLGKGQQPAEPKEATLPLALATSGNGSGPSAVAGSESSPTTSSGA